MCKRRGIFKNHQMKHYHLFKNTKQWDLYSACLLHPWAPWAWLNLQSNPTRSEAAALIHGKTELRESGARFLHLISLVCDRKTNPGCSAAPQQQNQEQKGPTVSTPHWPSLQLQATLMQCRSTAAASVLNEGRATFIDRTESLSAVVSFSEGGH